MFYSSLDGKGVWGEMDTCICIAESLCCLAETINIVNRFLLLLLVAQSSLTLCDHIDYGPPGFSVHGILQARILE